MANAFLCTSYPDLFQASGPTLLQAPFARLRNEDGISCGQSNTYDAGRCPFRLLFGLVTRAILSMTIVRRFPLCLRCEVSMAETRQVYGFLLLVVPVQCSCKPNLIAATARNWPQPLFPACGMPLGNAFCTGHINVHRRGDDRVSERSAFAHAVCRAGRPI